MDTATLTASPNDTTNPPAPPRRGWWRRATWADLSLIPLVFGVVLLTQRYLANAPLWLDEQMIAENIRDHGFLGLTGLLDYNQSAPLGWLWAQHTLLSVFGSDERVLRLLPFLATVGTLVLAWLAGRRWFGPVGAIVLVTLFATNASMIRYAAEVKQYSGDLFWTMLLLVLAMILLSTERPTTRQYVVWWSVAALACLFSMGAMLATPVFAVVIVATAWLRAGWRTGWREAFRASLPFLIWLAVFTAHYAAALRYVVGSDYMTLFWGRRGYPPANGTVKGILHWAYDRLDLLAIDPLGLDAAGRGRDWLDLASAIFWPLVLVGILIATYRRRPFGALFAGIVLFAYALAVAEIVPLYMRMAMWIIPAVFVAVAFAADGAARGLVAAGRALTGPSRFSVRGGAATFGGLAGAVAIVALCAVLAPLVITRFQPAEPSDLDERAAVAWLMARYQPGDLTLVLSSSRHTVRWYADDKLMPRQEPVLTPPPAGQECQNGHLPSVLGDYQRVLVYGYLRSGQPERTGAQLRADLTSLGATIEEGSFGKGGMALVARLNPAAKPAAPTAGCYVFYPYPAGD